MNTFEEVKKIAAILKSLEIETDNIVNVKIVSILDQELKENILYYDVLNEKAFNNLNLLSAKIKIDKEGFESEFEILIYEEDLRIFCEFEDIFIDEWFKENKTLRKILWMFYCFDSRNITKETYRKLLEEIMSIF